MNTLVCGVVMSCLVGVIGGAGYAQSADQETRPAKVFTVQAAATELQREYPAIVFPSREVELSFRVSGRVIELPVRGATQVAEGDVIARLDPRDFESNIEQLESQRDQALAQLDALRSGARTEEIAALEAAVEAAEAQVEQAREQAERTRQLVERNVAAPARLEQDEATLRVAEANLRAQEEQLTIGRTGGREEEIEAAEAALRGLETQIEAARDNLGDTTLKAPFSGIVARRDIENFTNIQAGQTVVLLQALATVDLVFDVPGPDVTTLAAAGPDKITSRVVFDALPDQTFDAEFVEFSTQADAATQTYRGRVAVSLPERTLILPGMVGRVISTAASDGSQILRVPLSAVAPAPDGSPFVWIVDPANKSVSKREITLGEASGDMVEAVSGVSEGETVVSAGISQLQDGMTIRPVTEIGG